LNIRFVADSTLDIPQEYIERYGITVLPAFVNYDGESYADNGVEFDREQFYNALGTMETIPTTSAPSPGVAREIIHNALDGADHLFLCSLSDKLSGIHNVMSLVAKELPPERVTLYDTQSLTLGGGFQVIAGAQTAKDSDNLQEIETAMMDVFRRQSVYAAMLGVDYLRRGGRVSWGAGAVGSLLKIRPIVIVEDGLIQPTARVRKHNAWLDTLANFTRKHAPLEHIAFLHAHNFPALDELRERIADIIPPNTITSYVTPSIGVHTGPGAIGVATVSQSPQR